MLKDRLITAYNSIVNFLSFSGSQYQIRRLLNTSIDHLETIEKLPDSHPRGFIKMFRKRRISIVESYVKIVSFLGSNRCNERLAALQLLTEQILHSKSLKMPLNTARIQMALMKEAVKCREDRRSQLERLRDFSISSFGQPRIIRKYLKEIDIIEVPEEGQQLKDLHMGWDPHVHDNASYGRKTPTQLIIDAFIKGLSSITVVYNTLNHIEIINEAIEAGRILGIHINLGLEFSIGDGLNRFHYIYLFPYFTNISEFVDYLDNRKSSFKKFLEGVEQYRINRVQTLEDMIHNFNETHLPGINEGYQEGTIYYLDKLKLSDIDTIIPRRHATRVHLGELLYTKLIPVFFNRVIYLKSLKRLSDSKYRDNQLPEWEYRNILKKYEEARQEYKELNPEKILELYFPHSPTFEPKTVFNRLEEIFDEISSCRANIKIIHPLKFGFARAVENIIDNYLYIGHAEIYNMHDTLNVDIHELELFARFIHALNTGRGDLVKEILEEQRIEWNEKKIGECIHFCSQKSIIPTCGSNSTGRTSFIPGMGFIYRGHLLKHQNKEYFKHHYTLPNFVSRILSEYEGSHSPKGFSLPDSHIISMGRSKEFPSKEIGDEKTIQPIPIPRAWRYIQPWIKSILYILMGFIPAFLTIGWEYAVVWFAITGIRNAITDFISGKGYRPKEWRVRDIDLSYLSHSLFWTGFSVPLLDMVKSQFEMMYPFIQNGIFFEFSKFFFICIINGMYLVTHNTIRGFDKSTIMANFFRSIMAWPFATLFSPIGNFFLIPSIVQAKFWSDFVAGLIEGTGKFKQRIQLRERDINELIPHIKSKSHEIKYIAILDLLYFFQKDPRTRNSLKYILLKKSTLGQKIRNLIKLKHPTAPTHDFSDYEYLKRFFSETTHYCKITDFILGRYKPRHALSLINLLSETYNEFNKWLIKYNPNQIDEDDSY